MPYSYETLWVQIKEDIQYYTRLPFLMMLQIHANIYEILLDTMNTKPNYLTLQERMNEMALNLDRLREEVAEVKTVHESAIKFIASLVDELKVVSAELKAKNEEVLDTSELDDLVAKLDESTNALAAAISTTNENPTT